ncbi:unnamed protein product [Brassica oleracea]|nr:unnamed protein product [Brassica oleracea]
MGNGSLFLADLKLAGVLFSVEFDFCSTANCPSVFDAQANYLNQKLLTVDVEPKHIRTKTYMRKLVIEEILQSDWQSSIIIIGGANMIGWPEKMIDDELEIVRNAGVVQLQREIPYSINIQVAKPFPPVTTVSAANAPTGPVYRKVWYNHLILPYYHLVRLKLTLEKSWDYDQHFHANRILDRKRKDNSFKTGKNNDNRSYDY